MLRMIVSLIDVVDLISVTLDLLFYETSNNT